MYLHCLCDCVYFELLFSLSRSLLLCCLTLCFFLLSFVLMLVLSRRPCFVYLCVRLLWPCFVVYCAFSGGYPSPCYQSDRRIQWWPHSQPDVQSAGHQCKKTNNKKKLFFFPCALYHSTNYFKAIGLGIALSGTCLIHSHPMWSAACCYHHGARTRPSHPMRSLQTPAPTRAVLSSLYVCVRVCCVQVRWSERPLHF